jgi:hypothetical protein
MTAARSSSLVILPRYFEGRMHFKKGWGVPPEGQVVLNRCSIYAQEGRLWDRVALNDECA